MAINISNDNGDHIIIFDDGSTMCFEPTGEWQQEVSTVKAVLMFQRMAGDDAPKMGLRNAYTLGKLLEKIIVGISKNDEAYDEEFQKGVNK